ncbi:MAG: UvrD-helicase domain-containing protein, partial [Verrucomicrobiota bacterium]
MSRTAAPEFAFLPEQQQPGIHLLEASAGTGKTFTIEGLVMRLVACEGHT